MSDAGTHLLTMPKWGLAMTKGTVVGWLLEEGSGSPASDGAG